MERGRPWIIRRSNQDLLADWDGREATWTDDEAEALEFVDRDAAKRILRAIPRNRGERAQAWPRETRQERREWLRQGIARRFAVRLLNAEFFADGRRNPHYVDLATSGAAFGREVDRMAEEILARRVRVRLDELPRPVSLFAKYDRKLRSEGRERRPIKTKFGRPARISEN